MRSSSGTVLHSFLAFQPLPPPKPHSALHFFLLLIPGNLRPHLLRPSGRGGDNRVLVTVSKVS